MKMIPSKKLNADSNNLRQKEPPLVSNDVTTEIFVLTDDNVATTASRITDGKILDAVIEEIEPLMA